MRTVVKVQLQGGDEVEVSDRARAVVLRLFATPPLLSRMRGEEVAFFLADFLPAAVDLLETSDERW